MYDLRKILSEKLFWEKALGFQMDSSFYEEFSISENYGPTGVREHFDLVFREWKDNLKYMIELVQVLNLKVATWFGKDDDLGMTYDELWHIADSYVFENYSKEDLQTYLHTLD